MSKKKDAHILPMQVRLGANQADRLHEEIWQIARPQSEALRIILERGLYFVQMHNPPLGDVAVSQDLARPIALRISEALHGRIKHFAHERGIGLGYAIRALVHYGYQFNALHVPRTTPDGEIIPAPATMPEEEWAAIGGYAGANAEC